MQSLLRVLVLALIVPLISGCDTEIVERGQRYVERLFLGVSDQLTAKVSANREPLHVEGFLPKPNYQGNADDSDRHQLVDGALIPPPMWTHRESVGWFGHTPVVIDARRASSSRASGRVRIHAGHGLYADSALPRQIDVYSDRPEGMVVVGSYQERPNLTLADKRNYWLEVPVTDVGQRLVIVLHARTSHVHLDEIEFVPDASLTRRNPPTEVVDAETLEAIRSHAAGRLRVNMALRATDRSQSKMAWREAFGRDRVISWVADPWRHRMDTLGPDAIDADNRHIQVLGTNSEFETFAIGLYDAGMGLRDVTLRTSGLKANDAQWLRLEHIVTAEGDVAFDPLPPLSDNTLKLQSGWPTLIWCKLDLTQFAPGKHKATLDLSWGGSPDQSTRYTITIDVADATSLSPAPMEATVWGYTSDQPIWSDAELAVKDQRAHYVNVWTLHPDNIPGLALDGRLEQYREKRLNADLKLYRGQGRVRLYLGWTLRHNPLGLSTQKTHLSASARERLILWLHQIAQLMENAGYAYDDWELYPLDEPSGPGLDALVAVADAIRNALPEARIYANPITTHTHPSTAEQLNALDNLIDTWQPMLSFAREEGRPYFKQHRNRWGFYHNPPVPAKFSDPIADYRAQGWWAWQLGANGVGFWSYSDSTGSSVWDDFDGRRPDFAVVYEKTGDLVTSRRWEGFAEGIEDYRLLVGSGLAADLQLDLTTLDTLAIRRYRARALDRLNP